MKNWIIAALVAVIAIGGAVCGGSEGGEGTPILSGDDTVAEAGISRADYCRSLDEARDRLSKDDDSLFYLFQLEIIIDETQAWRKLDDDPSRKDAISFVLSQQIDAARDLIALEPHTALESLHYDFASDADFYAELTETLQRAFQPDVTIRNFARSRFTTTVDARAAVYRSLLTRRCPF